MRQVFTVGLLAMATAWLLPLVASDARASDLKVFRFTYPVVTAAQGSGNEASGPGGARQLRGTISLGFFTGDPLPEDDDLLIVVLESPKSCGVATPITNVSEFTVQWPADCVFPTDDVIARFSTSKGPLEIQGAFWANASGDSIAPAEVQQVLAPATTNWALVVLVLGLGLAGFTALRRGAAIARA